MSTFRTSQNSNSASSTCVIESSPAVELQPLPTYQPHPDNKRSDTSLNISSFRQSQDNTNDKTIGVRDDGPNTLLGDELPSPTTATAEKKERWNHPRTNLWRTLSTFWCFIMMGANDAAYGVCIFASSFFLPPLSSRKGKNAKRKIKTISRVLWENQGLSKSDYLNMKLTLRNRH